MEYSVSAEDYSRTKGRTKWFILLAAVLLSVLTSLAMRYVDRFGVQTEQLLKDNTFSEAREYWEYKRDDVVDSDGNRIVIRNSPGASHEVFQNVVLDTPAFYRFSYTAEVNEVVPSSPEEWALASIAIIYRDQNGDRTGSEMINMLSGTVAAESYSVDLLFADSVASIDFAVRLYRAGGEFIVREPVMSRLKELPVYKAIRFSIIAAWAILLVFLAYTALGVLRVWQLTLLVAMAGVVLAGTMMPEAAMTVLTQKLAGLLPEPFLVKLRVLLSQIYGEGRFTTGGTEVSKLGHFLVFMCIGFFSGLLWRKGGIYYAIASIVVFALVTEALQTLVYGRTTLIADLILDSAGGLLGLVAGVALAEFIGLFRKPPIPQVQADYYEEDQFNESNRH